MLNDDEAYTRNEMQIQFACFIKVINEDDQQKKFRQCLSLCYGMPKIYSGNM